MRFYGFHGVYPEERKSGQYFIVNLECTTDLQTAGESDDLENTINYADIFKTVKNIVEGRPRNLLEAVAEEITRVLMLTYKIKEITIRISKPDLRFQGGSLDYAGVEIVRFADPGNSDSLYKDDN